MMEEKVEGLNNEVKSLVKEIQETTIITNARQSIMYNNDQIEKKYGYYDKVRRITESLLQSIENSNISVNAIRNLRQDLILNNPNYWLANALACLTAWVTNDRENTEKELKNALLKDEEKTSLFFCLVNLKLKRTDTSINWLNKYLNNQDPSNLSSDFITILDLVSSGVFGNEEKTIVLNKIRDWFIRLNQDPTIQTNQVNKWKEYIKENEDTVVKLPCLEVFSKEADLLKTNLITTSSYQNVLDNFSSITNNNYTNKSIDDIISNLIYEYETKEQEYQKDNLKNRLIIECNGNREQADKLFKKQESIYLNRVDLVSLLTNIIMYKDLFKVSNETQKLALALNKKYIIDAYEEINKSIYTGPITIETDGFTTTTNDGTNVQEIEDNLNVHLNSIFNQEDKDILLILLGINILGIIGIFVTMNSKILSGIIIVLLIIGNLVFFAKLGKRKQLRDQGKSILGKKISDTLEKTLAEAMDYSNMIKDDQKKYEELKAYLTNINPVNYINTNNERNIEIGGNDERTN